MNDIKKLKILMLNYEFPPLGGGTSIANYYILKELSKKENLQIHLVTSSSDKFKIKNFSKNVTIHYLDIGKKENLHYQSIKDLLKYSFKAYKYSKQLIISEKFDFIHAFFGIPSGYLAMKLGLPYLVSLRGSDVPFHTPKYKYLDFLVFKRLSKEIWTKAKFVVANSKGLKEEALVSSPHQKIEVIYNGIDTHEFKPFGESLIKEKTVLISTGRLAEHKGYHYLIEALAGLEKVELVLIGGGNKKEMLQELALKYKVKVVFKGKLEHSEIAQELQRADIFVLPSLNEGMSNSLLEAIASGLPVLVTNVGGSAELVSGNGFIVEKANSLALREKIILYLSDKELIKQHSRNSQEIAKNYTWKKVAQQYTNLYHSSIK